MNINWGYSNTCILKYQIGYNGRGSSVGNASVSIESGPKIDRLISGRLAQKPCG